MGASATPNNATGGKKRPARHQHHLRASSWPPPCTARRVPVRGPLRRAKHGVLGLVKTLALEGADLGIRTAAVCPAYVRTPLVEAQIAEQARAHGISEERVLDEVLLRRQAVKRLIEPEEVGAAVGFLLGPGGETLSGSSLMMDQGWTAG